MKPGEQKGAGSTLIDLPGRKLAVSKKPRMLTPSEVELLRQDLRAALKVLGQDEIDGAHQLMRRSGFRSSDFEILRGSDPSPPAVTPPTGIATVRRKSNGTARTYMAGRGSRWLLQLESDLKTGLFGRP
jgi:hypothetical protein